MAKHTAKRNGRAPRGGAFLLAALILTAVALASASGYFLLRPDRPEPRKVQGGLREASALEQELSRMSEDEIQAALDKIVEEGMFRISIASEIVALEDGEARVRIENNPENRYVMQVSLYLDETGDEIYASGLIDPGYYIQNAKFSRHLDPGEYAATAVFTAFYPDTKEVVGTVGAQVRIEVFESAAFTAAPTQTPAPSAEAGR